MHQVAPKLYLLAVSAALAWPAIAGPKPMAPKTMAPKPVTQTARPARPQKPAAAPPPVIEARPEQAPTPMPLNVVGQQMFCDRMRRAFGAYAEKNGYDAAQTTLLASAATVGIVSEFKSGRAADYISADVLATTARVPNRAPQGGYLPLASFVGNALGLGGNVTLALSAGELRFIPYAQRGMEIVVIAQNAASLTPERARKVSEVARANGIKIHVIWVGASEDDGRAIGEARSLGWLASTTGGVFANLSGRDNPCAPLM